VFELRQHSSGCESKPGAELQSVPFGGGRFRGVPGSPSLGVRGKGVGPLRSAAVRAAGSELSYNSAPQSDGRDAAHFGRSSRAPAVGRERWAS